MMMNSKGLLSCLRYCLPPNSLSYCGPNKTQDLVGYRRENIADQGLAEMLSQFETLYHYLCFIAAENGIDDPFAPQVVEAYWLGNHLLSNIKIRSFYLYLHEKLGLKKKLSKKALNLLYGKLDKGALPHHSFHVFNVFHRSGHLPIEHTIATMDACRIGWGKVVKINADQTVSVKARVLEMKNNKLKLSQPKEKLLVNNILGKPLLTLIKPGDWVSFHWQMLCDKISNAQVNSLKKYTLQALALANGDMINW